MLRGGPLSNREIVDLLQPFIVTSWNGAGPSAMEPELREIFTRSAVPKDTNVFVFILDHHFHPVHAFRGLAGRGPGRSDFKVEIATAMAKLNGSVKLARPAGDRPRAVPDLASSGSSVPAGVRLFIRRTDDPVQSMIPVVEVVPMKPNEWDQLLVSEGSSGKEIEADALRSWLVHLYPPAIRAVDALVPFRTITGRLKLEPSGSDEKFRYAVLHGPVQLTKDAVRNGDTDSAFEGTIQAVVTYPRDVSRVASLRGVIDGVYLYRVRGERAVKLSAAIESRPE
jgi:hypothetical protein